MPPKGKTSSVTALAKSVVKAKVKTSPKSAKQPSHAKKEPTKVGHPVSKPKAKPPPKSPKRPLQPEEEEEKEGAAEPIAADEEFDMDTTQPEGTKELASRAAKEGLFHNIDQSRAALNTMADKVVERFQRNANAAILELITLIFNACNCDCTIQPAQLDEELSEVFSEAVQTVPPSSGEYAVGSHEKRWKKFTSRFREFWTYLVRTANRGPLWGKDNNGFIQQLKPMLACLPTSSVRSLRHTSTVAVYGCIDGLIDVAKNLRRDMELASQGARGGKSPAKSDKLQSKVGFVEELIKDLFESVFVTRYRDIFVDIRALSIQSLGQWIQTYPSFFLADTFTKYVGWSLYDKEYVVREVALKALEGAFTAEEGAVKMQQFTQRFLARIIEMTQDIKPHVAAESVRLISDIFAVDTDRKLIDNTHIEDTLSKVLDGVPAVRMQAARFFRNFLRAEFPTGASEDPHKTNRQKLDMVMDFMDCFNFTETSTYVVDCMWDIGVGFLYDWEQVMDALMGHLSTAEPKEDEESKKDHHTLGLVHGIMLKLNDQQLLPPDFSEGRAPKTPSKLNAIQKQAGRKAMSEMLASCLPELMIKFHEPAQVVWLAEIVQNMDFSIYSEKQLDKWFHKLLETLGKLFFDFDRTEVLAALSKTWHVLTTTAFPMQSDATKKYTTILKTLEASASKSPKGQDAHSQTVLWQRVAVLYQYSDLNSRFWERILTTAVRAPQMDPVVIEHVAQAGFLGGLWKIHSLQDTSSIGEEPEIKEDLLQLARHLVAFLALNDVDIQHKLLPLQCICDLLMLNPSHEATANGPTPLTLSEEELLILVDVWVQLLQAEGARFEEKEVKDEWRHGVKKATIALCRVLPSSSPACHRMLTHYADDTALLEIMRYHRSKVWRYANPSEAWAMEFHALTLLYADYLSRHGQQEEQALQAFHKLALQFSREHIPHFASYKKDFAGSVSKLLRAAVEYVMDDPLPRCKFLSGMRSFCPKLLLHEASSLLMDFQTRCEGIDKDLLGHGDFEELRLFEEALQRAAGVAKEVDKTLEKKVKGKRKRVGAEALADHEADDIIDVTQDSEESQKGEWRGRSQATSTAPAAPRGTRPRIVKLSTTAAAPKPKKTAKPSPHAPSIPLTTPKKAGTPSSSKQVARPASSSAKKRAIEAEPEGTEEESLIVSQSQSQSDSPSQSQSQSPRVRRVMPIRGTPPARPTRAERASQRSAQANLDQEGGDIDLISSQPSQELSQVRRARSRY